MSCRVEQECPTWSCLVSSADLVFMSFKMRLNAKVGVSYELLECLKTQLCILHHDRFQSPKSSLESMCKLNLEQQESQWRNCWMQASGSSCSNQIQQGSKAQPAYTSWSDHCKGVQSSHSTTQTRLLLKMQSLQNWAKVFDKCVWFYTLDLNAPCANPPVYQYLR